MKKDIIYSALFGVTVGDALGVPVEFRDREYLNNNPVTDMIGYGSHNQPAGTWSDDSSLTFCLAESLCTGYDLQDQANRFVAWYEEAYWTPHGEVFDVGIATSRAIYQLTKSIAPTMAGGAEEGDNGNGSLMRILPIAFHVKDMDIKERFRHISDVSSLTHRHIRSVLACFIYIEFALQLMEGIDKFEALQKTKEIVNNFLNNNPICSDDEINKFHRILENPIGSYDIRPIYKYTEPEIASSGYVVHSLEASIWCLMKAESYEEAVLKAVNLGKDTDTTAAIAGGLAGMYYGFEAIPQKWIDQLARKVDIFDLCNRLDKKMQEVK
ncbi:MAG: ADP-ribosylglycohydrolase family protein [Dysgonomonas sp.]|nr:ADP-ribosylglycohydrolase family protein [Dysgonomonas sp.]